MVLVKTVQKTLPNWRTQFDSRDLLPSCWPSPLFVDLFVDFKISQNGWSMIATKMANQTWSTKDRCSLIVQSKGNCYKMVTKGSLHPYWIMNPEFHFSVPLPPAIALSLHRYVCKFHLHGTKFIQRTVTLQTYQNCHYNTTIKLKFKVSSTSSV